MRASRTLRVRMDSMGPWHFTCVFFCGLILVTIAMIVGWTGPPVLVTKSTSPDGDNVVLYDTNSVCSTTAGGQFITPAPIQRCWSHYFVFNSRWTQYFDVQMIPSRMTAYQDLPAVQSLAIPLTISWYGLKEGGNIGKDWVQIYSGNTTRALTCAAGQVSDTQCDKMILFRTNSVPYQRYFMTIAVQSDFPTAALQQFPVALSSVSFYIRYRSTDFAMFELGFKTTFLVISIIVLLVFLIYTGLDCGCGRYCFCIPRGNIVGLSFQRQQGVNWLLPMLFGLVLFNEPLLWMRYYARNDAGVLTYMSVAGQLTFVAFLLAYWLIEWGLIKANQNRVAFANPCRFYCPKLSAIFVYWILAIAVYGWILMKQQADPLFDWVAYARSTASGGNGPNAQTFILVFSALVAGLYLIYLTWLIIRSFTVLCTFKEGEKYLFSMHFIVLVATALGIAAGSVYGVEVGSAFDFMFVNVLYNVYIYILVYLYTPLSYADLDSAVPPMGGVAGGAGGENGTIEEGNGSGESNSSSSQDADGGGGGGDGNSHTNSNTGAAMRSTEEGRARGRNGGDIERGDDDGEEDQEAVVVENAKRHKGGDDNGDEDAAAEEEDEIRDINDGDNHDITRRAARVAKASTINGSSKGASISIASPSTNNNNNALLVGVVPDTPKSPMSPVAERLAPSLAAILLSPPKRMAAPAPAAPIILPPIPAGTVLAPLAAPISLSRPGTAPSSRRASSSTTVVVVGGGGGAGAVTTTSEPDFDFLTPTTSSTSAAVPLKVESVAPPLPPPVVAAPTGPPKPQVIVLNNTNNINNNHHEHLHNSTQSSSSAEAAAAVVMAPIVNPFEAFDDDTTFGTSSSSSTASSSTESAAATGAGGSVVTHNNTSSTAAAFANFDASFGDAFDEFK